MIKKLNEQTQLILARRKIGLRQEELSERINIRLDAIGSIHRFTWNTISKFENGWKKTIRQDEAECYAIELGVSVLTITERGINVR
jgi:ribosome-binding protein aMBF1 (putative translation factor)